jgi:hypothetical protein
MGLLTIIETLISITAGLVTIFGAFFALLQRRRRQILKSVQSPEIKPISNPYAQQQGTTHPENPIASPYAASDEKRHPTAVAPTTRVIIVALIVTIVSSAILIAHTFGIGPFTSANRANLTPPPGYQYFIASGSGYQLLYPDNWQSISYTSNGLKVQEFYTSTLAFILVPSPQKIPPEQYAAWLQDATTAGQLNATNIQLGGSTTISYQNNTWTQEKGTLTVQGAPYNGVILGKDWTTGTFLVVYAGPDSEFSADEQTYFNPMLNSMSFSS